MNKPTERLPPLNVRNKNNIKTQMSDTDLRNEIWRSNTEPLSQLLKSQVRNDSLVDLLSEKSSERIDSKLFNKKSTKISPLKIREEKNTDMLQYKKSIKHLMNIFQQKSNQMKSLNINCYHSSLSPKKAPHFFNQIIIKEVEVYKKHKSKLLYLKKKLRKSLLKTEGNEVPQKSRKKNLTQLKKILNVHSPCIEQRGKLMATQAKPNSILLYPLQQPQHEHKHEHRHEDKHEHKKEKDEASLYSKRRLKDMKIDRSKRTTIGGWKIDKLETNYPIL